MNARLASGNRCNLPVSLHLSQIGELTRHLGFDFGHPFLELRQLPERLDTVVIVLLAVGFPIAMVLAWAFDLTPNGIEVESESRAGDPKSHLPGQSVTLVLQALVLVENRQSRSR